MSENRHAQDQDWVGGALEARPPADGRGRPRLLVQSNDRTVLVRFADVEILYDEADIRRVGEQLNRLLGPDGPARLVLNLDGVRYLASGVLGTLARLHQRVEAAGGDIVICGLDPLLRDMLRISHLDRVFDVCADEAEALMLLR